MGRFALYWLDMSFFTASGSSEKIFMRINGSLPFCVSIDHGLGRASKSLTLPCDNPRTCSPNNR